MSLPALDDIVTHTGTTVPIDGVVRIETTPLEETAASFFTQMRSVYPHQEVFGQYCTVNDYVDCPPDELFEYLSDTRSLEEWTYTLRGFTPSDEPGLWLAYDQVCFLDTEIYTRTVANAQARTVDYHCAWDQGRHLWMIYLMRVLDAQVKFNKPGSVVLWTNCRHPSLRQEPVPDDAAAAASATAGSATSGTCSVQATGWC